MQIHDVHLQILIIGQGEDWGPNKFIIGLSMNEGSCFSVTKSCSVLWDPMDCSTPGFPVPHYLLEFAQVHVHWIGDAIQQAQVYVHSTSPSLCPLYHWYYPTIQPSALLFSTCLQSFPAPVSFLMSWLFESDGQSIGTLASASVFPMNIQD